MAPSDFAFELSRNLSRPVHPTVVSRWLAGSEPGAEYWNAILDVTGMAKERHAFFVRDVA